jgi:hypothetical protein
VVVVWVVGASADILERKSFVNKLNKTWEKINQICRTSSGKGMRPEPGRLARF